MYKVDGISGKTFNWYSDIDIQLNCRIEMMLNATRATYISGCSLRLGKGIEVRHRVYPDLFTKITPMRRFDDPALGSVFLLDDCGYAQFTDRDTLRIQWQQYEVVFTRRGKRLRHLNAFFDFLNVRVQGAPRTPYVHGLLGQTHNDSTANVISTGNQGEGVIEGTVEDYIVPDGMSGTGFKFNRFKRYAGKLSSLECRDSYGMAVHGPSAQSGTPDDETTDDVEDEQ